MIKKIILSRHEPTIKHLKKMFEDDGYGIEVVSHMEKEEIPYEEHIIGNAPLDFIAEAVKRGKFTLVRLDVSREERGSNINDTSRIYLSDIKKVEIGDSYKTLSELRERKEKEYETQKKRFKEVKHIPEVLTSNPVYDSNGFEVNTSLVLRCKDCLTKMVVQIDTIDAPPSIIRKWVTNNISHLTEQMRDRCASEQHLWGEQEELEVKN